MGPFAYYSPIGLGFLLALLLNSEIRGRLPASWEPSSVWIAVAGVGLAAGLMCQLLMIGAQGIVAQVLPVPGGRSVRGRPAVVAGFCIIGTVALLGAAVVMYTDSRGPATIVATLAGAIGLVAVGIYGWSWPTAARDFSESRT